MTSRLALHLLELFAKGELTGTQVQSISAAAALDGLGNDDLIRRLALAGTSGLHSGHVARDVLKAAGVARLMDVGVKPYFFELPGDARKASLFLPREIFSEQTAIWGLERLCLTDAALGATFGLGPLLKGWAGHNDVNFGGDLREVGVLGVHGDGVTYTASNRAGTQKGILVLSLNVLSSDSRRTKVINFLGPGPGPGTGSGVPGIGPAGPGTGPGDPGAGPGDPEIGPGIRRSRGARGRHRDPKASPKQLHNFVRLRMTNRSGRNVSRYLC